MLPNKFNELLKKINESQEAYAEIYNYFQPRSIIYLTRRYKNLELAEDVVQDFFFKKLPNIKVKEYIEHPARWIFHACEKLLQTELRRNNPTTEFIDSYMELTVAAKIDEDVLSSRHDSDDYFETLLLAGISSTIVDSFRKMDKKIIEIFIMRYFEGYSDKEIADILNIKYENVRKVAYQGKNILKIFLKHVTILFLFQSIK